MKKIWQTFFDAYRLRNAFNFTGTANLTEFWYFVLGFFAVYAISQMAMLALSVLNIPLTGSNGLALYFSSPIAAARLVFVGFSIIPAVSLMCRRYRDAGLKAWVCPVMLVMILASIAGGIALLGAGISQSYSQNKDPLMSNLIEAGFVFCMFDVMALGLLHVLFLACETGSCKGVSTWRY